MTPKILHNMKYKTKQMILGLLLIFVIFTFWWNLQNRIETDRSYLSAVNPTVYTFNYNLQDIRKAIRLLEQDSIFRNSNMNRRCGVYNINKISKPGFITKNEAIFSLRTDSYIHSDWLGDPLGTELSFAIHADSLGVDSTSVRVAMVDGELYYGFRLMVPMCGYDFSGHNRMPAGSSTIEEYEILHTIGKILGQEGMPAIKYPSQK